MEIYIKDLYEKLRPLAENEGIYKQISFHFAETTPHNYPGDFCYSDGVYYYYGSIGDRGEVLINKTSSLFEVAYYIFSFQTSVMAFDFEKKNRTIGQPLRSVAFPKQIELMGIIGDDFKKEIELKINGILEKYPYEDDDDYELQNTYQADSKTQTFTLETNGSHYEDKYVSMENIEDNLYSFTPAYWNFMTLVPSIPIKGSSFIQVGSPDAKTNNKMTVEIGFPGSDGIELYRYYTMDKEEILQIFKDYYQKQELPNYKKWENVSSELKPRRPRRFL